MNVCMCNSIINKKTQYVTENNSTFYYNMKAAIKIKLKDILNYLLIIIIRGETLNILLYYYDFLNKFECNVIWVWW